MHIPSYSYFKIVWGDIYFLLINFKKLFKIRSKSKFPPQEVSIHVYEKRGSERVGRGRRKEAITEILKTGIQQLELISNPWLLQVLHGVTWTV